MIVATVVVAVALATLVVVALGLGSTDEGSDPGSSADGVSLTAADEQQDGQVGAPATDPAGPAASEGGGVAGAPAGDDDSVRSVEGDDQTEEASSQPAPGEDTEAEGGASSVALGADAAPTDVETGGSAGADDSPPVTTLNGPVDADDDDGSDADDGDGSGGPVVKPPGDRTTPAGQGVVLAVRASHDGDGELRYSAQGLPDGLTINTTTGVITGLPTESGIWEVAVTVAIVDGGATTQRFTWTVTNAPDSDGCREEGRARSRNSVTAIAFEVVNETDGVVDVHWLNHSGNRVRIHTLAPTETVVVESFATNPWLVADADTGACLRLLADPADGDRLVLQ